MEEKIQFLLLNQETVLQVSQIFNQTPLISEQQVRQIRLPMELKNFKVNLSVLHTCLYYVLSIEKNIKWGTFIEFREKCLCSVSNYYIKRRMNFQIYQYGYLCSKILALPLQKVMHIVYYMIYARLASKPYISHIIVQAKNRNKVRRFQKGYTIKSQNADSMHSKSVDSRHFTVFMDNNNMELDTFRRDIKKILNSQVQFKKSNKKNDNKRYFNIKNVYPEEDQFYEDGTEGYTNRPFFATAEQKNINIPLKVGALDNSSVISRLKLSSTNCKQDEIRGHKRLQMRRQKFNENFDCGKKYNSMGKTLGCQSNNKNQWGVSNNGSEDILKLTSYYTKMQKHHYDYYNTMASNIKSKNKDLDEIRQQCVGTTFKKHAMRQYDWNRHDREADMKIKTSQATPLNEIYTFNKEIKDDQQNKVEKDQKPQDVKKNSQQKEGSELQKMSKTVGVVTNKNILVSQDEKLMIFNKKVNNKFKLQKYKHQYRQFLKTQMFEKQKHSY